MFFCLDLTSNFPCAMKIACSSDVPFPKKGGYGLFGRGLISFGAVFGEFVYVKVSSFLRSISVSGRGIWTLFRYFK